MRFLIPLFFLCALAQPLPSQTLLWSRGFGGSGPEIGYAIVETLDGGYLAAGSRRDGTGTPTRLYLVRVDNQSNLLWERAITTDWRTVAHSLIALPDGSFMVAGETRKSASGPQSEILEDVYVAHLDESGDPIWERRFGAADRQDYGWSITPARDGGFVVAGSGVRKIDANGNLVWEKMFAAEVMAVRETSDGGFIVTGNADQPPAINIDALLLRLSPEGDSLWQRTLGAGARDQGYGVIETADSGFIVVGRSGSYGSTSGDQVYIVKTNRNGNYRWHKTFDLVSDDDEYAWSISRAPDGSYIVAGGNNSKTNRAGFLMKLRENGDTAWSRFTHNVAALGSNANRDGSFVVTGAIDVNTSYSSLGIVRIGAEPASAPLAPESIQSLKIFPNPATGDVVVDFADPLITPVRISVTDLTGRVVVEVNHNPGGVVRIPTAGLASGSYLVSAAVQGVRRHARLVVGAK